MCVKIIKLIRHIVAVLVFAMLASVVAAQVTYDPDVKYASELLKKGEQVPDFKLRSPDGKSLKLSDFKGKYVVLDFGASWCPDCRKDIPEIQRMYNNFHGKGVEFVGVSFDTDVEKWKAALQKYKIVYPQGSELVKFRETKISKDYGVKWIPSLFLIDKERKVVLSTVLSYKLEKKLTELFGKTDKPEGITEKVLIGGSKGKLSAIIQRPKAKPGEKYPMAILMHGFNADKNSYLIRLLADSLMNNGVASIRFDFNGHGESEGEFSEMTVPNEVEDAKFVYKYIKTLPYVSDVVLVGHSQGGVVAGMAAGELGTEKIKGVVLLAPAAVLRDDVIRGNTFGVHYNPTDPPEFVQIGENRLGGDYIRTAFDLPIYETSAKYAGASCIIHGNADRIVPYTYGERYHDIWKSSELYILDGFDHGFSQNVYRAVNIATDFILRTVAKK